MGCSKDLPESSKLDGLRVLALIASEPEVNSGASVTVTPLVSDVTGGGRSLEYVVTACRDPGVSIGAVPSCEGDPSAVSSSGSFTFGSASLTGAAPSFTVSVPNDVLALRSPIDQFNGVGYLVFYEVSAPGTQERVSSFRRMIVSTRSVKNLNPRLSAVRSVDGILSTVPSSAMDLSPVFDELTAESYQSQLSDGSLVTEVEKLIVSWFSSTGEWKRVRTEGSASNRWDPGEAGAGGSRPSVLVVVLRDGRGGEDFVVIGP